MPKLDPVAQEISRARTKMQWNRRFRWLYQHRLHILVPMFIVALACTAYFSDHLHRLDVERTVVSTRLSVLKEQPLAIAPPPPRLTSPREGSAPPGRITADKAEPRIIDHSVDIEAMGMRIRVINEETESLWRNIWLTWTLMFLTVTAFYVIKRWADARFSKA